MIKQRALFWMLLVVTLGLLVVGTVLKSMQTRSG